MEYDPITIRSLESNGILVDNWAKELAATFFSRMFADAFGQVSIPLIQTVKDQIRQGY